MGVRVRGGGGERGRPLDLHLDPDGRRSPCYVILIIKLICTFGKGAFVVYVGSILKIAVSNTKKSVQTRLM